MLAFLLVALLLVPGLPAEQNGIPAEVSTNRWAGQTPEVLRLYYEPSPERFSGFGTLSGSERPAAGELWMMGEQLVAQYRHAGYALKGGGYGFVEVGGQPYLIQDELSPGWAAIAGEYLGGAPAQPLTAQQLRLYRLGSMPPAQAVSEVLSAYDGIISLKSPNDLGRIFCVVDGQARPVGTAIVGGVAAINDWAGAREGLPPLGYMRYEADGREWAWAADLSEGLYQAAGGDGGPVIIGLIEGRCEDAAPVFACPVADCGSASLVYNFDGWEHIGVDLALGPGRLVYAPADAQVVYAGFVKEGCGGTVILDYGLGWTGRLCHLTDIWVSFDQRVPAGWAIGQAGNSGATRDGSHLHIETFRLGQPISLLEVLGDG